MTGRHDTALDQLSCFRSGLHEVSSWEGDDMVGVSTVAYLIPVSRRLNTSLQDLDHFYGSLNLRE